MTRQTEYDARMKTLLPLLASLCSLTRVKSFISRRNLYSILFYPYPCSKEHPVKSVHFFNMLTAKLGQSKLPEPVKNLGYKALENLRPLFNAA